MRCSATKAEKEQGNALVLTVFFLAVLFGFSALSIDLGNAYVNRQLLQEASDASALGAVQTWALQVDVGATVNVGTQIASNNFVQTDEIVSITPGVWNAATTNFIPNQSTFAVNAVPAVRVIAQRQVNAYFARLFGFSAITVRAQSIAIAARATAVSGMLPWAVCQTGSNPPNPCELVTLKFNSLGDGNPCLGGGSYGAVSLGGSGASVYRENIQYGYPGTVRIGDVIPTESGNMVGPTQQGLNARLQGAPPYNCDPSNPSLLPSPRIAIVAVTRPDAGSNKSQVVVTDFWVFAMNDPQGGEVTGRYIMTFTGTEIDPSLPPSVGINSVALVN